MNDTKKFRAINPRGYYAAPVSIAAAFRVSPAFGVLGAAVIGVVLLVLHRIGSDMTPAGVVVRRVRGRSRLLAWSDVAAVEIEHHSKNYGDRIALTRLDGVRVVLPAPTSNLAGFVDGLKYVRAAVATAHGATQRAVR